MAPNGSITRETTLATSRHPRQPQQHLLQLQRRQQRPESGIRFLLLLAARAVRAALGPTSRRGATWMSLLEGFRDSRTGRDGGGGGLPISGTAAPSPDAAAAGATPRETGKNGHDVVFALVLALYCYQQRRRKQGEQGRRGRRVSSAGSRGTDGGTDGDGDGGGERLDAIGRIVGGGEGGVNSRSSQIEASTACSAAAVSVVASGAAAPCDVDPECEAEMLVTELQDARRLHLREVSNYFFKTQRVLYVNLRSGLFTTHSMAH